MTHSSVNGVTKPRSRNDLLAEVRSDLREAANGEPMFYRHC